MAKAPGTDPSILPLPQGGGAHRPIDETFATNLSTGSGTYSIPLQLPRGVNALTPALALTYSSGAGNGPFGMGWSFGLPSVTRRTERSLPGFEAALGADVFLLGGRELTPDGGDRYREVVQVEPSRIRHLTSTDAWEVTKTGSTMRFGTTPDSRTADANRTLEWNVAEIVDPNGNAITFTYTAHGGRAYLAAIEYAIYRVELAYEDRPDAHSSFRSGHEVRTAKRCSSITLTLLEPSPAPVKSYRLTYSQAPHSEVSLLAQVQLVALTADNPALPPVEMPLPPVTLEYTEFEPSAHKIGVFSSEGGSPPPSLRQPDMTLLDFEGTGLPGVIEIHNGTARFWRNDGGLRWGNPRALRDLPALADLRTDALRFVDMEGNGTADLLVGARRDGGYYPNVPGGGWGRKVEHRQAPSVVMGGAGVRMLDVDGDNRADLVHSDAHAFYHYLNRGAEGWAVEPIVVKRKHALDEWPDVDLASPHVRFADVVGDGRSHLVVVHDRRIVYYPNLGMGRWGPARRMSNAPRLPRNYDPGRLFLADADGDGTADVVYVDFDSVYVWLNRSGNAFSDPIVLTGTPPVANAAILVADMDGTGTNGVLWSYEGALRRGNAYRYLDLAGGKKPFLLRRITNNRSVTTTIRYASSSQWGHDPDDAELAPGAFLPFPVPVVERLEVHDPSTGVTSVSRFSYWDGHFDGKERAFLGFAKAQRIDDGDAAIPASRTVSYFHNRDPMLKGLSRLSRTYGDDGGSLADKPYVVETTTHAERVVHTTPDGVDIRAVATSTTLTKTHEREVAANEVETAFEVDLAGNVVSERKTSRWTDDAGTTHTEVMVTTRSYARDPAGNPTSFVARETIFDGAGRPLAGKKIYYDGPAFTGLPEGRVGRGNPARERRFVMSVATAASLRAPDDPTPEELGYHRENDAVFGDSYFVDLSAQKVDARGNAVERKDPRGTKSTIEFDDFGIYPVRVTFANGLTTSVTYEYRYGQIDSHRGPTGAPQRFGYDAAGRLVACWRHDDPPEKPYIEYEHGAGLGSLVTLTRATAGAATRHRKVEYYDGLGESLQVRAEAEGGRVVVSGRKDYNAKGLVFRERQAYFSQSFDLSDDGQPAESTEYHYDARGRSTVRLDWDGNRYESRYGRGVRRHYDPLDLGAVPASPAVDTPRVEWLDASDRVVALVEEKEAGSYVTRYVYDILGNRTTVTAAGSTLVANTFDGLGRRVRSAYRDAGVYTYLFDAAGNLVNRTDGKGDAVFKKFDAINRVTEVRYEGPVGPLQEAYRYDVGEPGETNTAGNLTRVSGPFGEVRYAYSTCGCVRAKTRSYPGLAQPLTFRYETDSLKRFTKITYPDGFEQTITYNAGGLIQSLPGIVDDIAYGPTGKRTRVRYRSGVVTDYTYAPGSLMLKRVVTRAPNGSTAYQDLTYDHDPLGDVTSAIDGATRPGHVRNDRLFAYDALRQLVSSTGTDDAGAYSHSYAYDDGGNLERYPEEFGDDRLLHDDPAAPLHITGVENRGAGPYTYDAAGNLTRSLHASYEYDARNRLMKVKGDDGTETEFTYDHAGVRVVVTSTNAGTTSTTYDFDDVYTVTAGNATKTVWDDQSQVATIAPDGSGVVFHKDNVGSHVVETDLATGAFLAGASYHAFGAGASATFLAGAFGFAGKRVDAGHGLVFFGARYYLPEIGRFLTPDPLFLEQQAERFFEAPRSLHLYAYVLNNPMNMIDPYGLWFLIDDAVAAVAGFVVGAVAYAINAAVSGSDFSFGEMLFSGLGGAVNMWLAWNLGGPVGVFVVGVAMLAAPAITGGLDQVAMGDDFGSRFVGFLSFCIKFASAPITSTVGLLIGGVGTGFGLWGGVEWFKGGVIAFEYDPTSTGFGAVTLGATVNIWFGSTSSPDFEHELYHSRQYTYFGDLFIPWWIVGGVYGLISSAIAGNPQWGCFPASNPGAGYGNPLEDGATSLDASLTQCT